MIIAKMNIAMIIIKNRLLTCGMNNEVWNIIITK